MGKAVLFRQPRSRAHLGNLSAHPLFETPHRTPPPHIMKTLTPLIVLAGSLCLPALAQTNSTPAGTNRPPATRFPRPDVRYQYTVDSERHDGIPAGKIIEFVWKESRVFTGTIRQCAIYIPAQYKPGTAAPLMVFQDGVRHYLRDTNEFR